MSEYFWLDFDLLYIALVLLVLAVLHQTLTRLWYEHRLRQAGGVHAPVLANEPITGMAWICRVARAQYENRLLGCIDDVFPKYGTPASPNLVEVNILGNQRYLFTREPEHIKTILTGKFDDFGKGPEFHHICHHFLGDSIFATDGQKWQDSRSLVRPMFVKNRISDLEIFERKVSIMMKNFPASGETFNIMDLFFRMTIDIITEFLLGEGTNSLENPRSDFVKAFTDAQRWQAMLMALAPLGKLVPKYWYLKSVKGVDDFIAPFIERALALDDYECSKRTKDEKSFTFLHALAGFTRDPKVIRDQLVAVLLAGRDTTASTLSWCMYELSHYPEAWAKLRAETMEVVGPDREPTYEHLRNLKYLQRTLNETLRLFPAVPFNVRYALQDTSLPSPVPGEPAISVLKGDAVFYSTMSMQRREDLYPPTTPEFAKPSIFSPERWEHWQPRPWEYIPFNGGPRICIGQSFALTELAYVLVRLVQRFERVEYRGDWAAQYHKVDLVGVPGQGVPIALWEAKREEGA